MINTDGIRLSLSYNNPEIEDIRRCLMTLYSTREGSQPLDRDFGLNQSFVGKPLPIAQNEFALEIMEKTERYEPRVKVDKVTYAVDSTNGVIIPTVHLEGGESEDEY